MYKYIYIYIINTVSASQVAFSANPEQPAGGKGAESPGAGKGRCSGNFQPDENPDRE